VTQNGNSSLAEATKKTADNTGKDVPVPLRRSGAFQFFREVSAGDVEGHLANLEGNMADHGDGVHHGRVDDDVFFRRRLASRFGERWLIGALQ